MIDYYAAVGDDDGEGEGRMRDFVEVIGVAMRPTRTRAGSWSEETGGWAGWAAVRCVTVYLMGWHLDGRER